MAHDDTPTVFDTQAEDPLGARVGETLLRLRRGAERDHVEHIGNRSWRLLGCESYRLSHVLIEAGLRLSGTYAWGLRNAVDIRVVEREVPIAGLPEPFEGLRLLHLSDLHLDLCREIQDALVDRVAALRYDVCLITGDYRAWTIGPIEPALEALASLRPHLRGEVMGVLGNHDTIDMIPGLEALDIRMLINESTTLERDGMRLHIAGIDDPNRFATHNLERAAAGVPAQAASVLMAHSPEPYRAAASLGFDLMLCGHTHGGQICLPGGVALIAHTRAPRFVRRGAWRWRHMQGYTSVGAGSSIVPARFNCPPEVTVHTLTSADPAPGRP